MMLTLYRALTTAALPLIRLTLARRMSRGREDAARFGERMGVAGRARPEGFLVWIHAASVGESLSVLSLIDRMMRECRVAVLITTGTVTSARLLAERLLPGAIHQYVPVDRAAWVSRFLDHWRPDLALWVESEFWPNMLCEIARRRIPAVLVNARISPRSFARWRNFRGTAQRLLATFSLCLAQTEEDAASLRALGAADVRVPGNLKFAAAPLPCDARELARMEAALGQRPRWLAASTHDGEEELIAAARKNGDLAIVVPRHPQRGAEIAAMLRAKGNRVSLRSESGVPGAEDSFYVADTMGELGLFFRLAPVAFIGGSLVPHGGQNILEPVRLGACVVHGPHMTNFREIAREMDDAGGAVAVTDAASLAEAVHGLLADPARRARVNEAAAKVAAGKSRVLDETLAALAPFLDARA
jgi:3-deoxy-D-manno-octulosonic-acid transferase